MNATVYVVTLCSEYTEGDGVITKFLSAHRTREGAIAAVSEWRKEHFSRASTLTGRPCSGSGLPTNWCPSCHWGVDVEDIPLGD